MAKAYVVTLKYDQTELQELTPPVSYKFEGGNFKLYNGDKIFKQVRAQPGDRFVVLFKNGKAYLKEPVIPQKRGNLVAWLLGFTKWNRGRRDWEFEKILEEYRKRYMWSGYQERWYIGPNYRFVRCNKKDGEQGHHNVAALIRDEITKEEIIKLIPLMNLRSKNKEILKEHFSISDEEIEKSMETRQNPQQ